MMVDYMKKQCNVINLCLFKLLLHLKDNSMIYELTILIIEIFDIGGNSFDEI